MKLTLLHASWNPFIRTAERILVKQSKKTALYSSSHRYHYMHVTVHGKLPCSCRSARQNMVLWYTATLLKSATDCQRCIHNSSQMSVMGCARDNNPLSNWTKSSTSLCCTHICGNVHSEFVTEDEIWRAAYNCLDRPIHKIKQSMLIIRIACANTGTISVGKWVIIGSFSTRF